MSADDDRLRDLSDEDLALEAQRINPKLWKEGHPVLRELISRRNAKELASASMARENLSISREQASASRRAADAAERASAAAEVQASAAREQARWAKWAAILAAIAAIISAREQIVSLIFGPP